MMKKIFFWRVLAILFVASLWGGEFIAYAQKQQDSKSENIRPWVELSDEGTLTFRYGSKPDSELDNVKTFALNDNSTYSPPKWTTYNKSNKIKKVVFDSSFADARPITGRSWFADCYNLETIEGIENLNTSEMTSMSSMFFRCSKLKSLDLSKFNTEKVTDMGRMFYEYGDSLRQISLDLSNFNTQNVTSMISMFNGCSTLKKLDISSFNTSKALDMISMFSRCKNLKMICVGGGFTTENVLFSTDMFSGCVNLPGFDENYIDKSKAIYRTAGGYLDDKSTFRPWAELSDDGTLTFSYGYKLDSELDNVKTFALNDNSSTPGWSNKSRQIKKVVFDLFFADARPTTGRSWFDDCSSLESIEGIENLNTSEMTNMNSMFYGCRQLQSLDLSKFNTGKVTNMAYMFYNYGLRQIYLDLSSFNTQNVTSMISMFNGCYTLEKLDISNFNTSKVTDMSSMFDGCRKLRYIFVGDGFTIQNVTVSSSAYTMFRSCINLPGFDENATDISKACYRADGGYFDKKYTIRPWAELADDGTLTFSYGYKPELGSKEYELNKVDNSGVSSTPGWYSDRDQIIKVEFAPSFAEVRPATGFLWFSDCRNLETIKGIEYLNTSEMTDMSSMFCNCETLISLDVSRFNTGKVTNMSQMFFGCSNLKSLDLSSFDTQNVTNMNQMFAMCSKLTSLDLSNFDMRNVEQMYNMFALTSAAKYIHISDKFVTKNASGDAMLLNESSLLVCPQDQYDALKDSPLISRIRPYFSINAKAPFGTLCVPIGGNLTEGSFSGFDKLYKIENADADKGTITMTEVTSIEPGVPYVYRRDQSDNDGIITFTVDNSLERVSEPSNDNRLLKGTFEGIYAPSGSYILLTDGNFHPVAADNSNPVGAYRAYLDLSSTQSGSGIAALKTFRMVFSGGETTGIDSISADQSHKAYYDMTGRRVIAPQKGNLYIVNGKKVLYN